MIDVPVYIYLMLVCKKKKPYLQDCRSVAFFYLYSIPWQPRKKKSCHSNQIIINYIIVLFHKEIG